MNGLCKTLCYSILFFLATSSRVLNAQFSIDNTPLDTRTWHKTTQNTPFDPTTWDGFIRDVTNPQAVPCKQIYNEIHDIQCRRSNDCGLTHTEKFYLRPFFGDLVDSVQVFPGTRIEYRIAGQRIDRDPGAITAGNRITTQRSRDELDPKWMILLAHEMTHVDQYARIGREAFCQSYTNEFLGNGFDYYAISFEHSAHSFEISYAYFLQHLLSGFDYPTGVSIFIASDSPYVSRSAVRLPAILYDPPQEYGITSIVNTLDAELHFKWHDEGGEPRQARVAPGERYSIQYLYPGGKVTSPKLYVEFEQAAERWKKYRLGRFRSVNPESYGREFQFVRSDGMVDLVQRVAQDPRFTYKYNGGTFNYLGGGRWVLRQSSGQMANWTETGRSDEQIVVYDGKASYVGLTNSGVYLWSSAEEGWRGVGPEVKNANGGWADELPNNERASLDSGLHILPPTAGMPEVELSVPSPNCCCRYLENCCCRYLDNCRVVRLPSHVRARRRSRLRRSRCR